MLRKLMPAAVLLIALAAILTACGDGGRALGATTTETEATSDAAGLDPAAVEASVQEFLEADEYAADLSPTVDCGDEPAETLIARSQATRASRAASTAAPSQGFSYTGEIEDQYGPNALGGSSAEGSITDPASVEKSLNETDPLRRTLDRRPRTAPMRPRAIRSNARSQATMSPEP